MKCRAAVGLSACLLGWGWAGCTSPPPPDEWPDAGTTTGKLPVTPDVVVIGATADGTTAKLDGAVPRLDAGVGAQGPGSGAAPPRPTGEAGMGLSEGTPPTDSSRPSPLDTADAGGVLAVDLGDARPPLPIADAGPPPALADAGRVGCLPGRYKGTFEGEISALVGLVQIDVTGDITIDVDFMEGPDNLLQIHNGLLQGTDNSAQRNPLFARLSGVLNCATGKIEKGVITDGAYSRVDEVLMIGPPTVSMFTGTVAGDYSENPPSAAGTWQVYSDDRTRTAVGTWNAALQ